MGRRAMAAVAEPPRSSLGQRETETETETDRETERERGGALERALAEKDSEILALRAALAEALRQVENCTLS